jgi:hypothetical protein
MAATSGRRPGRLWAIDFHKARAAARLLGERRLSSLAGWRRIPERTDLRTRAAFFAAWWRAERRSAPRAGPRTGRTTPQLLARDDQLASVRRISTLAAGERALLNARSGGAARVPRPGGGGVPRSSSLPWWRRPLHALVDQRRRRRRARRWLPPRWIEHGAGSLALALSPAAAIRSGSPRLRGRELRRAPRSLSLLGRRNTSRAGSPSAPGAIDHGLTSEACAGAWLEGWIWVEARPEPSSAGPLAEREAGSSELVPRLRHHGPAGRRGASIRRVVAR